MIESRSPKDCNFFLDCSSSLCPLDPDLKAKVWCPEENDHDEVCRNPEFTTMQFVKTQNKIARRARKKNEDREDYFTFEMLNRDIVTKSGIRGIPEPPESIKDTKKWYSSKEKKWILSHPEKKQLSVEEIEKRRERMKSIRKAYSFIHSPKIDNSRGLVVSPNVNTSLDPIHEGESDR